MLYNGGAGLADPPENGWLHPAPASAFGKSPYIWEAVYPGATPIAVEEPINSHLWHQSTIAAASAASLEGTYPSLTEAPYVAKYTEGDKRHIVTCSRASEARIFEF